MSEPKRWSGLAKAAPILIAIFIGGVIGAVSPELGRLLGPFGSLYLSLLLMCIIPIIGAAVVSSLGRMVADHKLGKNLLVIALVFWVGMLLASAIGTAIGWAAGVGSDLSTSAALGDLLLEQEATSGAARTAAGGDEEGYVELFEGEVVGPATAPIDPGDEEPTADQPRLLTYLGQLIPGNLAVAYLEDNYLAVLFFSVLLGVALGLVPSETREVALGVVEALFDSLLRIITWIIWLLPLGLVCIIAGQVAEGGLEFIPVFSKVIVVSIITTAAIMALFTVTIWRVRGGRLRDVLRGLREPLLVAFATRSSFASIPSALVALRQNFGLQKESVNLFLPLGITMNPIGSALFFSVSAIFAVQLHENTEVLHDPVNLVMFVVGAVLAGLAAMGLPGPSAVWLLGIVLDPIGVPPEVGMIALVSVATIIDPFFTMVNVFGNCTVTCILDRYLSDAATQGTAT